MVGVERFWLGYLFVSFSVGIASLGLAIGLAVRRRDGLTRAFLACYAALSLLVTASLVLAFGEAAPGAISVTTREVFQYLESIVGMYGVMLTLPLLAHRVFGVVDARRERLVIAVVLTTLALQHVTEFALGSTAWDERGDRFEDGVLVAIVAYTFWIACTRLRSADAQHPLATRVFALLVLGVPGTVLDVYFGESWGIRLYPLWYCATSLVLMGSLVRKEPERASQPMMDRWGLSQREFEVAEQVARGLSNKDAAAALHISPNTVKTHLRTIFEKAGVHSRFELIARMHGPSCEDHPDG